MMLSREGDRPRRHLDASKAKGGSKCQAWGHEALAAIAYHLRPDDYLFPTYRDRALMLGTRG